VFIMGVGVAGLQAIATARRLGAIVTATDVRPATKEQVVSLGADIVYADGNQRLRTVLLKNFTGKKLLGAAFQREQQHKSH